MISCCKTSPQNFCQRNESAIVWKRIDKTKNREVKYNEIREKAHWANVQRCGGVWICPVCAKQITENVGKNWELALTVGKIIMAVRYCCSLWPLAIQWDNRLKACC